MENHLQSIIFIMGLSLVQIIMAAIKATTWRAAIRDTFLMGGAYIILNKFFG